MIAPDSTVDDFDATLTCEEYYMEREWDDEDEDFEDEDELADDSDDFDDEDSDDEDYEDDDEDDDYEDDDEDWEDMEDDVSDCFECDGSVSENGFARLFDMERRGYFA